MEEEYIAQRDAALAVTHELQQQLQDQREVVERRALNAECLRSEAEKKCRHMQTERRWELQSNQRQFYLALACCSTGALLGWIVGLVIALSLSQPLLGFLAVIPAMALGLGAGLVAAKVNNSCLPLNFEIMPKPQMMIDSIENGCTS